MIKHVKPFLIGIAIIGIAGGLWGYWTYSSLYPSTQDAFVKANIITIAPQITGKVVALYVIENQRVDAGDILFEINSKDYRNSLIQYQASFDSANQSKGSYQLDAKVAGAGVKSAKSALKSSQAQFERIKALYDKSEISKSDLDSARAAADNAQIALSSAQATLGEANSALISNRNTILSSKAALETAKLNLERTVIKAPVSGWITNISIREGSIVSAYSPLFSLIDNNDWWIEANFKETDINRIRVGQPTTIKIDSMPDKHLVGEIESIAYGSGASFSLLPAENASGNWVKVTQRFPIRITLQPPYDGLRLGASTTVRVDTTDNEQ